MVNGHGKTFRMQINVQVGGKNKRFAAAEERRKHFSSSLVFFYPTKARAMKMFLLLNFKF